MKLNRERLSKFLPGFIRKLNHHPKRKRVGPSAVVPSGTANKSVAAPPPAVAQPAAVTQPKPQPPFNAVEMLDSVAQFFRRHLVCSDQQLAVLSLWSLYTWCYRQFPTAAYLHIRSAEPHSAKSLCLRLLASVCNSPWYVSGVNSRTIMESLLVPERSIPADKPFVLPPPLTIMLDDCHHIFNHSERQTLLALFNGSSRSTALYPSRRINYSIFGPKAFAGNAALPRSLACRCIPMVLQFKKPSEVIARFTPESLKTTSRLAGSLQAWAIANSDALAAVALQAPARLPAGLVAPEQDCAEPLVHIADRIGGPWPEKARSSLEACFKFNPATAGVQLLSDIRAIFFCLNDPDHLSSRDLLTNLRAQEARPWAGWKSRSGQKLATMLKPFGVNPQNFHRGSSTKYRGYKREDFLDVWERYVLPIPQKYYDQRSGTTQ